MRVDRLRSLTSSASAASAGHTASTAPSSSRRRARTRALRGRGRAPRRRRGAACRRRVEARRRAARDPRSTARSTAAPSLTVRRPSSPPPRRARTTSSELVGPRVEEEGGRELGRVRDVAPGVANDVLELDSGLLLPLSRPVCWRSTSSAGGSLSLAGSPRLANLHPAADAASTSSPSFRHAFAWLTERPPGRRPSSGRSWTCGSFGYRDFTPLGGGQVDDEPYGGGAGMVLRVDVVAAALDARLRRRAATADRRAVAAGPAARPGGRRGAGGRGAPRAALRALRGLRRAHRRAPRDRRDLDRRRTSSPAASCRRWCSSTRIARLLPGALGSGESRRVESFSAELDGGLEYPHYTRPAEFRGWECRTSCSQAITRGSTSGGAPRAASGASRDGIRAAAPADRPRSRPPRNRLASRTRTRSSPRRWTGAERRPVHRPEAPSRG